MEFNETELAVISCALRIAADQYKANAEELKACQSLADQFSKQEQDAMRIYHSIGDTAGILA